MTATLIEINIYCCLLAAIYFCFRSFLKRQSRRLFLCTIPLLAAAIFFLKTAIQTSTPLAVLPMLELEMITIGGDASRTTGNDASLFTAVNLYWLGFALFMFFSTLKVFRALSLFKKPVFLSTEKVWISTSNHPQSFTFLNRIHLSNNLDERDKTIVLEHELLHVKHKHSFDLLWMELIHAIYWFNPVLLLMKKELICVHEYQVDKSMYQKHSHEYLKHLLASSMGIQSSQILLTSQFYNGLSLTQRKKQMKTKIKNNWAVLAFIPSMAMALALVSFTSPQLIMPEALVSEQDSIYDNVDQNPEYVGGTEAMVEFLVANIKYPEKEKSEGIEEIVYIEIIITKEGAVSEVRSVKAINSGFEREAIRVIESMPNWIPGEHNGKKVNTRYTLPIKFKLPN